MPAANDVLPALFLADDPDEVLAASFERSCQDAGSQAARSLPASNSASSGQRAAIRP